MNVVDRRDPRHQSWAFDRQMRAARWCLIGEGAKRGKGPARLDSEQIDNGKISIPASAEVDGAQMEDRFRCPGI
jgi:hypothetical protein